MLIVKIVWHPGSRVVWDRLTESRGASRGVGKSPGKVGSSELCSFLGNGEEQTIRGMSKRLGLQKEISD